MATQTRNAFALQLAEKLGYDLTDPVQALIDNGVTTEGADFRGNDLITREEAITMFGRGLGVEGVGGTGGFGERLDEPRGEVPSVDVAEGAGPAHAFDTEASAEHRDGLFPGDDVAPPEVGALCGDPSVDQGLHGVGEVQVELLS